MKAKHLKVGETISVYIMCNPSTFFSPLLQTEEDDGATGLTGVFSTLEICQEFIKMGQRSSTQVKGSRAEWQSD